MRVTRKSLISGIERTRDIDIDPEKYAQWATGRIIIQQAAPHLSPADREFIISGITQDEWDDTFKEEEDEGDGAAPDNESGT